MVPRTAFTSSTSAVLDAAAVGCTAKVARSKATSSSTIAALRWARPRALVHGPRQLVQPRGGKGLHPLEPLPRRPPAKPGVFGRPRRALNRPARAVVRKAGALADKLLHDSQSRGAAMVPALPRRRGVCRRRWCGRVPERDSPATPPAQPPRLPRCARSSGGPPARRKLRATVGKRRGGSPHERALHCGGRLVPLRQRAAPAQLWTKTATEKSKSSSFNVHVPTPAI